MELYPKNQLSHLAIAYQKPMSWYLQFIKKVGESKSRG